MESDPEALLNQLEAGDKAAFALLYRNCFPAVDFYIRKNKGTSEDARDVFQEALVVLLQKIRQPEFVLTASLKTYVYSISRNLWLKHLRDNKLVFREELSDFDFDPEIVDVEIQSSSSEQKVQTWLSKITAQCRYVLRAIFYYEEPMEKLMIRMGWKNKHTAANQKYKCMEQVKREAEKRSYLF